ncbi:MULTISPECIES: FAD-binding oxidoreductase [unclassified Mycobacterium]|uniref:FAD-binding oxidoreductase n=1 Tax=unclassified Mycobacterium TaxID=2642494 RepID=UPI0029C84AE2|nr:MULTISPECIES: FAD-linked oxidase C-terminal domain-containing protein [unclassified Mycobacterium]
MNTRPSAAVSAVIAALPDELVLLDPDVVATYSRDHSLFTESAIADAVLVPRSTAEVAECLRLAHRHGVPVIPRGAGSGLSGAANATVGSIVLSLHRMNAIVEVDEVNRIAVTQPGVITSELRDRAAAAGLFYPPDPGSVDFSTIGGNVATNAGGMCCLKYGVTGDFVIALEAVLADGRILRTGRRTAKGVAGYDLTHLLVGSEGTLAVITEITLKLLPAPRDPHTLVAAFASLDEAGGAMSDIASSGITPSMLEILDRTTVQAVDDLAKMGLGRDVAVLMLMQADDSDAENTLAAVERICSRHGSADVAVSSDPAESAMLLAARRLALPALERLGNWLLDDVAVPRSRVTELMSSIESIAVQFDLTIGVFGHAGDGNLHPTVIYDESNPASRAAALGAFNAITQRALDLGGTITGEHGVGRLKSRWLTVEHDEVSLAVQRSVKNALDPERILNPGAVLESHS